MTGRRTGLLSVLVCLVIVGVLVAVRPDPATDFRRRYADVEIGETGRLRQFDVTVTRVRRAAAVPMSGDRVFLSRVSLLVVEFDGAARVVPTFFTKITLQTRDGARYEPRPEFSLAGPRLTQPGFTTSATLVFELPPDRVDRARLIVDPDGADFDAYDAAVRVDLGLRTDTPITPIDGPLPDARTQVTP